VKTQQTFECVALMQPAVMEFSKPTYSIITLSVKVNKMLQFLLKETLLTKMLYLLFTGPRLVLSKNIPINTFLGKSLKYFCPVS
jgi:hypothetical protein